MLRVSRLQFSKILRGTLNEAQPMAGRNGGRCGASLGTVRLCQFHALPMIFSSADSLGHQLRSLAARLGSATNTAGSPGLRGASLTSIAAPTMRSEEHTSE